MFSDILNRIFFTSPSRLVAPLTAKTKFPHLRPLLNVHVGWFVHCHIRTVIAELLYQSPLQSSDCNTPNNVSGKVSPHKQC
jgi:hypothetical protein